VSARVLRLPPPSSLAFATVVALALGACGGGKQNAQDSGPSDVPVQTDTPPTTDTPTTPDGGAPETQPTDMDGGAMDAPGIECAPLPGGGPVPAGTAPMYDGGPTVASTPTRPELGQQVADDKYTVRKALAQGYIINSGAAPDGGVGPVTYSLNDNWDPQANGIGDVSTFTPTFTVAADGSGTHTDLNKAFAEAIFLAGCGRIYIRLMPGEYRGQVIVNSKTSAPPITVYSTETDASKVRIVADAAGATAGSMTNSATLTVKAIRGFQMKNLTVANDYVEGSAPGNNQNAVAMLLQSDQAQFENVRFLGNIGTLYVKSLNETIAARSYFRDCYVEGDQDFIVGRGTAVFDHCEIKYLAARLPTGGTIGNPSTLVFNGYGFLFDSCNFTAEAGASGVFLGRQWMEESDTLATRGMPVGKMIVRNSVLGAHLAGAAPWTTGSRVSTPKNPTGTTPLVVYTSDDYFPTGTGPIPPEPFLAEYRNSGPGAQH
jgi:pectinesterase